NWGTGHDITTKCSATLKSNCISSSSPTSVKLVVPSGSDLVAVTVNGGTAATNIDNQFHYDSVVSGLSVHGGAEGTKLTISGANFGTAPPTVNWGSAH